jgi:chemotaxis protein methyltransferase CheR
MIGTKRIVLGITDLKTLFQSIRSKYSYDFTNFALSSFKRRLEDFMESYHINNFDELIHKFEIDAGFFNMFIAFQLVGTTEMFRDPEFWLELKELICKKYNSNQEIKVLIPDCNSGEELFTFQIISSQLQYQDKTKVVVTTIIEENIEKIFKGQQDGKKMEINIANFERFHQGGNLMEYFTSRLSNSFFIPELLKNVEVNQHNLISDNIPGIYDIIIFRNKMLYFNPQLKIDVLKKLDSVLKPGGYIAVGIKESIDHPAWEQNYSIISESERIYKKRAG